MSEFKKKCDREQNYHYLMDAMVRLVSGTPALNELKDNILETAESSEFREACDAEYALQEADVASGRDISDRWEADGDLIDDYLFIRKSI
jgi:hypothetical protein|tara:strand:- start:206 stop:475 length:270 start_codon:yes stop_codon:yes gene_type:complete